MRRRAVVALLILVNAGIAYAYRSGLHRPIDPRVLPEDQVDPSITYSNVLPGDYVGPETCGRCHSTQHDEWMNHPHRKMNQLPTPESVEGDFNHRTLELPTGQVIFTHDGDSYHVEVDRNGSKLRRYLITRTVGTVYLQYYIAKQIEGPDPADSPIWKEHMLPFSYNLGLGQWLPKAFSDADGSEKLVDGLPAADGVDFTAVRPYNESCLNCHNTYAYSYRVFHPKFAGFWLDQVSGAVGGLSKALAPYVDVKPNLADLEDVRTKLDPDKHMVTLGISCESCHFGGREHAINGEPIRFAPTSSMVRLTPRLPGRPVRGDRHDPESVNGICAQCHAGNAPLYANGASTANSGEALDFMSGACSDKLSCVGCHDPHLRSPPEASPTLAAHMSKCLECHSQYRDATVASAHSRHGQDVTCLDCHMPRQTMGLDSLVRTHRISRPVEASMVSKASLNACNLCHLDKSLRWTVNELQRGWGEVVSTSAVPPEKLDIPMGELWLEGDQPHRLVATWSWAHSPWGKDKLPELMKELDDPEPINRVYALEAVNLVEKSRVDGASYQLTAPPAQREKEIDALLERVKQASQRGSSSSTR